MLAVMAVLFAGVMFAGCSSTLSTAPAAPGTPVVTPQVTWVVTYSATPAAIGTPVVVTIQTGGEPSPAPYYTEALIQEANYFTSTSTDPLLYSGQSVTVQVNDEGSCTNTWQFDFFQVVTLGNPQTPQTVTVSGPGIGPLVSYGTPSTFVSSGVTYVQLESEIIVQPSCSGNTGVKY
jgi:hypothetical protein